MKRISFPIAPRLVGRVLQASFVAAAAIGLPAAAQPTPTPLTVVFEDCTEFAGLGSLPAVQIQGLVPAGYSPASFGPGVAGMVARAARCERISVGSGLPSEAPCRSRCQSRLARRHRRHQQLRAALRDRQPAPRPAAAPLRPAGPRRPENDLRVNPAAASLELFIQVHGVADVSHFLHGSVGDPPPGDRVSLPPQLVVHERRAGSGCRPRSRRSPPARPTSRSTPRGPRSSAACSARTASSFRCSRCAASSATR